MDAPPPTAAGLTAAAPPPPPKPRRQLPVWLRAWPIYLVAAAVVAGTYYVTRQRQQAGQADPLLPAVVELKQNIEIEFGDVTMQGRQKGIQRWVITSPKVALSKDGRYTYFDPDPTGRFLNLKDFRAKDDEPEQKVKSMDWKSDKARFDSFTEDLEMEGHAVITTEDKDVIKTERVEYKSRTKRVYMPKPVVIKMKDNTDIKADALEANTEAEVFELKGHVDFKTEVGGEEKL
jgi:LPS export ABC transporter protein LptC